MDRMQSDSDALRILKDDSWRLYTIITFDDLLATRLRGRWGWLDAFIRFAAAITASGSALGGLKYWSTPEGKIWWAGVAIGAALFSILSSTLGVSDKFRGYMETSRSLVCLRLEYEAFRAEVNALGASSPKRLFEKHSEFVKRHAQIIRNQPHDSFLRTDRLKKKVHRETELKVGAIE